MTEHGHHVSRQATASLQEDETAIMSRKKPSPAIAKVGTRTCPVCGKRAYSSSGIHPQCAVQQADALHPKPAALEPHEKPNQFKQCSWVKKCPQCGTQVHVQHRTCDCGYDFPGK
jgi:hypothetical protein